MTEDDAPTLGDLIMQLRRELDAAQRDDPANPIRFQVGPIELETTLAVTRAKQGNAGLVLKVLSLGGQVSKGDTNTTRVHLVLTPTDSSSATRRLVVSAEDTESDGDLDVVAGDTQPGDRPSEDSDGRI